MAYQFQPHHGPIEQKNLGVISAPEFKDSKNLIEQFVNSSQNTHNTGLSSSVAILLKKLHKIYFVEKKLDANDTFNQCINTLTKMVGNNEADQKTIKNYQKMITIEDEQFAKRHYDPFASPTLYVPTENKAEDSKVTADPSEITYEQVTYHFLLCEIITVV